MHMYDGLSEQSGGGTWTVTENVNFQYSEATLTKIDVEVANYYCHDCPTLIIAPTCVLLNMKTVTCNVIIQCHLYYDFFDSQVFVTIQEVWMEKEMLQTM